MDNLILNILFVISGVQSRVWDVTLKNQCALKGTSVVMECQYSVPPLQIVNSVSWSKDKRKVWPSSHNSKHFIYEGDYWSNCNLKIKDVQVSHQGFYFINIATVFSKLGRRTSAQLTVKELEAVVQPSTVTEGSEVNLTCVSGCPPPGSLVWFRDGRPVKNTVFQARREDAGSYHCVVRGQEATMSASVALNVQYAPEKVSLSMSPPRDVVKGNMVTFTCSSDARPPVKGNGYSLYKDGHLFSSGQSHNISVVQPTHSGRYHCQAWNDVSRGGSSSPEVLLHVQYPPENVSVSVDPDPVVWGSRANLTCSSDANPAADTFAWYRKATRNGSALQVGSGQVLSIAWVESAHAGLYFCRAQSHLGENNSTELQLPVKLGSQVLLVAGGTGVSLTVTLVLALVLFWKKRRSFAQKKASTSLDDDVIYTTVTMKPINCSFPQNRWILKEAGSKTGHDEDTQVIYSTVAKAA